MITRRTAERRFFLRPSKETNEAYVYCFAVAAARYGIDVYWLSTLSNHEHPGLHDQRGNYPEFLRYFHSLLARCLNAHLGRWEGFWSSEQSCVLQLGDGAAIFDRMVYGLTNSVKDHLVDKVVNWPGVNSLLYQLHDKPMVVKRPKWFFDEQGDMPEEVELRFVRPPEFAHLSHDEWADKLRRAVAAEERKAAQERERTGRRVLGRKAILRQSPFSCPKSCKARRGLKPRVATRDKWRRIELLQRNKRFQQRYLEAYERRRAGELDVVFPYGTYQLAQLKLVRVEAALE
jgi:hypothetical protein